VDELMALCDRLEVQQQEREQQHTALSRASLARFADAPTPANLQLLFHKSYTISPADLRKSILTLAVQGKLVAQDPNDEPADCILARLAEERERLVLGKLLPRLKDLNEPKDAPFDLPESWAWAQLGSISHLIEYGTSHKSSDNTTHVPVYRMGDIQGGSLSDDNLKYVPPNIEDLPKLFLEPGDVLFNRTNSAELVGKAAIFKGTSKTHTFASYLIRVRVPAAYIDPVFINLSFLAPYFRESQIEPEIVQQCGQANFNGTKLAHTLVPIPPLAEQRRIVAKVEQLMALVDALETQLTASRATAKNLLDALVTELTNGSQKAS
jgi:type I restriction enzyme S subunit